MSGETKKTSVQNSKTSQIPYKLFKPLVPAPAGFYGCRRCSPSLKRLRSTAWPCFEYKYTRLLGVCLIRNAVQLDAMRNFIFPNQ